MGGQWIEKRRINRHTCRPPHIFPWIANGSRWRCKCDREFRIGYIEITRSRGWVLRRAGDHLRTRT